MTFDRAPFLVIWEVTRACALACVHCRADAIARRHPLELTFRAICGGSRARAYAATGDLLASDPLCPYDPGPDIQPPVAA